MLGGISLFINLVCSALLSHAFDILLTLIASLDPRKLPSHSKGDEEDDAETTRREEGGEEWASRRVWRRTW